MMSPSSWRELIKPRLAQIFAVGKSRNLPIAYHCCGSIREIIPDPVELGLDVLNPIQCNYPGMEPGELKKVFGKKLTFMGGVDTQGLLPSGSAADVDLEVGKLIEEMAGDGGFILAASHTLPPENPLDKIFAMYERAGVSRGMILDKAAGIRNRIGDKP